MLRFATALLLVVAGSAISLAQLVAAEPRRQITMAAAADLKFAMDAIVAEFHRQNPHIAVTVSYGSSGNFFAQLSNRAQLDVFFSADIEYPQKLVDAGVADADTLFLYGIGRIVVWTRNDSRLDVQRHGMDALLDPRARKIAFASPRHAPYGRAAVAAMKTLSVYEQAKDRLVYGENVAQAAQFVESGAADIGIIALSLALAPELQKQGKFWEIPIDAYPRMDQGAVVMKHAKDKDSALTFTRFVRSEDGRSILRRFGFYLPGDEIAPATQSANDRPAEN